MNRNKIEENKALSKKTENSENSNHKPSENVLEKTPENIPESNFKCPFCSPDPASVIAESELCYAKKDDFPVLPGHVLVIPKRHFSYYFDAEKSERDSMWDMVSLCREILDKEYSPDGYNIIINAGDAAWQKVMHMHIHIIPRRSGEKAPEKLQMYKV
ncbi:MAG: HIT family protein [Methanomicrobium sp.]|nr:HIT family protein [Methanomicrobium sp.]